MLHTLIKAEDIMDIVGLIVVSWLCLMEQDEFLMFVWLSSNGRVLVAAKEARPNLPRVNPKG